MKEKCAACEDLYELYDSDVRGAKANVVKKLDEMTLQELWELFPVCLVQHRTEWKAWYINEKERLTALFAEEAIIVHHVGSTAVDGICAKPIIDILIEVSSQYALSEVKEKLIENGYRCMFESEKKISLNLGYTENGFAQKVFHVHLKKRGDNDELYFRDYLRDNVNVAKEYESLKCALLKKYKHNRDAYTEAKTEFITRNTIKAKEIYKNRYS